MSGRTPLDEGRDYLIMQARQPLVVMGQELDFDPVALAPSPPEEKRFPDISTLALDVSGACNMRCVYCAESLALPARDPMDRQTAIAAVERLFAWSAPGADVAIHFGSGEPLLQTQTVQAAANLAKRLAREQKRRLALFLTTNGTQLNQRSLRWLMREPWEIKVSLDGPREIHDRFRRGGNGQGTFDRIAPWVGMLATTIPEHFSTTSVLCRGTAPAKVYEEMLRLGVRRLDIVPVSVPKGSALLLDETDLNAYRDFIHAYAKALAGRDTLPSIIRFQKRLKRVLGIGNAQIACGAGRTFFAVGEAGGVYPCYRFVGIENYRLGNIYSRIQKMAVKRFADTTGRPYSKRTECQVCWAAALCDGPCFADVDLFGVGSPSPGFCEMTKADCEGALWLASKLREKEPQRLCQLAGISLQV